MANKLKAEGDVWTARLGGASIRPGFRNLLFFCENGQRPYRIVEVPDDGSDPETYVDRLSARELTELFERTSSLGAPAS